jgi:propionyl-CoA synthetase
MNLYDIVYQYAAQQPDAFWAKVADELVWDQRWHTILDDHNPPFYRWFKGGKLNTCYNAIDRHVAAGRGDQAAIIYDSPVTGVVKTLSYREFQDQVATAAGMLTKLSVKVGDRVLVYMPMIPEALVAMLACARIGAVHSVVFGGFAANELAARIDDAEPKVILCASCGIEPNRTVAYKPLVDQSIELATHKPDHCIVLQRSQLAAALQTVRDLDWGEQMMQAEPVPCVPVDADHPLYILYTSGTTGRPKGVVRDHGGHAAAVRWANEFVFCIQPGDVQWTASDVGWVVGHSFIVYGPLLQGATTVVFEGKPVGTPNAGVFWRVIEQHKVKSLFTAPTALRAIRKEDPGGTLVEKYDISSLQALYLAGERCDPPTLTWAQDRLGVPVVDNWWQTETGWPIAANPRAITQMPIKPGSPTVPMPGYYVQVLDETGEPVQDAGQIGALAIKLPLPPGCLMTLWDADDRYQSSYLSRYPGYYLTGDAGYIDADGYIFVMSRIDDVINVAGHRLSTGALEEVLTGHPDIAECAVFGVADQLKGELPLGLVVLKNGVKAEHTAIATQLVDRVRSEVGPVAAFKMVGVVTRLPKTRSGKILRGTMKAIADGQPYKMPATIDDPAILHEVKGVLTALGYAG